MLKRAGYLAGRDAERLADLLDMFTDANVRAVVAARGGYGSGRLLPLFDPMIAQRNAKIFVGYSDITYLLTQLVERAGLTLPDAEYDRTRAPLVALTMALVVLWGIPDLQLSIDASWGVYSTAWLVVGLALVVTTSRLVTLVAAYAAWTGYRKRYPGHYAHDVSARIEDVTRDLLSGTCACRDSSGVTRELQTFLKRFPKDPLTRQVRDRLREVRTGRARMRYHCTPG